MGGVLFIFVIWRYRNAPRPALPSVTPPADAVFTSTRYTTCLLTAPNGELWAGTFGGVLRRSVNGEWQKFTRQDGLPSNEVRRLEWRNGAMVATFPTGGMAWQNGVWQPTLQEKQEKPVQEIALNPQPLLPKKPGRRGAAYVHALKRTKFMGAVQKNSVQEKTAQTDDLLPDQICAAMWRGHPYAATLSGLYTLQEGKWKFLPQPSSGGTHISTLLAQDETLYAAMFGEGIWAWNGREWARADFHLPPEAREITALAGSREHLWRGTRRAGIWEYAAGHWKAHQLTREPVDHNCQALRMVGNALWVSTLEDGMAVRTANGWGHYSAGAISSDSPRQMAAFGGSLYLRHGNGRVDRFTGGTWERNICSHLPRREVSALAADERRLYVAQWGGWSEFDGRVWTHHLDIPDLQGLPVTALCPQQDKLWIGTQGRGLAEYEQRSHTLRWHDERSGLPDDWITTLACLNDKIYAGTFVGGLAEGNGDHWTSPAELTGENVTALEPDKNGGLFVATRHDVWHQARTGEWQRLQPAAPGVCQEAQALCRVPGGLWIGTRTGLAFCAERSLNYSRK